MGQQACPFACSQLSTSRAIALEVDNYTLKDNALLSLQCRSILWESNLSHIAGFISYVWLWGRTVESFPFLAFLLDAPFVSELPCRLSLQCRTQLQESLNPIVFLYLGVSVKFFESSFGLCRFLGSLETMAFMFAATYCPNSFSKHLVLEGVERLVP